MICKMTPVVIYIISVKEITGPISDIKMAPPTIISDHLTTANELWSQQPHGGGNSILVLTGGKLPGFSKVRQAACDQGGKLSQLSLRPTYVQYLINPHSYKSPPPSSELQFLPWSFSKIFSHHPLEFETSFLPLLFPHQFLLVGTFKWKRLIASYSVSFSSPPSVSSW